MLPTHVGMNRMGGKSISSIVYAPHTRGDEPPEVGDGFMQTPCSPHTWG